MYCSNCGAPLAVEAKFCATCGMPTQVSSSSGVRASPEAMQRVRPAIVSLLAVLKFIVATVSVLIGLTLASFSGPSSDRVVGLSLAVLLLAIGALAFACGYGLWKLRPYGRYLQIALSAIGLLGFPFGTIISILILVYMLSRGVRVLFSDTPIERLSEVELTQLRSLSATNPAALIIGIVVGLLVVVAMTGIMAAIAIPNLLTAIDRAKQKRTMADLRSIGIAVESYAVDHNAYPTATTTAELQRAVEPLYIKAMPSVDGWGNTFQVSSSTTNYLVFSHGKDGVGDNCTPGETSRFADEICFADGKLTRYPEGSAR